MISDTAGRWSLGSEEPWIRCCCCSRGEQRGRQRRRGHLVVAGPGATGAPRLCEGRRQVLPSAGASERCEGVCGCVARCVMRRSVCVCGGGGGGTPVKRHVSCVCGSAVWLCAEQVRVPRCQAQLATWGQRPSASEYLPGLCSRQAGSELGVPGRPWVVFQTGAGHARWPGCVGVA